MGTQIPRLSRDHCSRGHLVARILHGDPLTVVRAPVGSGKTALLAEAAAEVRRGGKGRVAWVSGFGTASAGSSTSIWQALCSGFGVRPPGKGAWAESGELWHTALVHHLNDFDAPAYLIIDDCEFLTEEDVDALVQLLERHPHLHLAVSSCSRTRFEAARASLAVDTTFIGADALRFTQEEAADYLMRGLPGLPPDVTRLVWATTGGNAALTKSALHYMRNGGAFDDRASLAGLVRHLREAQIVDVDGALEDAGLRELALVTSLYDGVTGELALAMSGNPDATALLTRLEGEGLGVWSPPGLVPVPHFRYSRLVLPHLRSRARAELPESRITEACRKAAVEGERSGDCLAALECAVAGQAWLVAEEILLRNVDLVMSGPVEKLASIAMDIPDHVLARSASLSYFHGAVRSSAEGARSHTARALYRGEGAVRARRGRSDPTRDAVAYMAEAAAARRAMRVNQATDPALRSLELFESVPGIGAQLVPSTVSFALVQIAQTMLAAGEWEVARRVLVSAEEPGRTRSVQDYVSASRAAVLALCGDMTGAKHAADQVGPAGGERTVFTDTTNFMTGVYLAAAALESFDVETAQQVVARLESREGTPEFWAVVALLRARVDLLMGRHAQGMVTLAAAREKRGTESLTPTMRAELDAARQLLYSAADSRGPMQALIASPGRTGQPVAVLLMHARSLFHAGRFPQALQLLSRVMGSDAATQRHRAEAMGLQAAALLRHDCDQDLGNVIDALTALLTHCGVRTPLALLPANDLEALAERDAGLAQIIDEIGLRPISLGAAVSLTRRELQILSQLALDQTLNELGERLFLSQNTVRTHVKSIYKKLGASKRQDALAIAGMHGLLSQAGTPAAVPGERESAWEAPGRAVRGVS